MYPKTYETLAQAAERTGITVKTLRRWVASGRLPAFRYGPRLICGSPRIVEGSVMRLPRRGPLCWSRS